jgi:hypothetical protein
MQCLSLLPPVSILSVSLRPQRVKSANKNMSVSGFKSGPPSVKASGLCKLHFPLLFPLCSWQQRNIKPDSCLVFSNMVTPRLCYNNRTVINLLSAVICLPQPVTILEYRRWRRLLAACNSGLRLWLIQLSCFGMCVALPPCPNTPL